MKSLNSILMAISAVFFISRTIAQNDTYCFAPGTCEPPIYHYNSKILDITPRRQWDWDGGFSGEVSIQTIALACGSWVSQDLIRKAAPPGLGAGNETLGYQVTHLNIR
jgi:hypothetical protein